MYEKTGVMPSEVLKDVNNLPEEKAKVYENIASNTKKQGEGLIKDMDRVNKQASGIPSITGNVKGLQFLAAQNVEINKSIIGTNAAIVQSMHQDASIKKREAIDEGERLDRKAEKGAADQRRFHRTTVIDNDTWTGLMKGHNK